MFPTWSHGDPLLFWGNVSWWGWIAVVDELVYYLCISILYTCIIIYLPTFLAAWPCNCSQNNVHLLSGKPCWLYPWPAALPLLRNEAKRGETKWYWRILSTSVAAVFNIHSDSTRDASVTSLSASSIMQLCRKNKSLQFFAATESDRRFNCTLDTTDSGLQAAEKPSGHDSNSQTIANCTVCCSVDFNHCFERCRENGVAM